MQGQCVVNETIANINTCYKPENLGFILKTSKSLLLANLHSVLPNVSICHHPTIHIFSFLRLCLCLN